MTSSTVGAEHLLTGESTPVVREPGSTVHAGTLNVDGALTVRVTATVGESALGRLRTLLDEAKRTKSRFEREADRVVRIFLPAVITLALPPDPVLLGLSLYTQGFLLDTTFAAPPFLTSTEAKQLVVGP